MLELVFPARKECKQLIHLITPLLRQVQACSAFIAASDLSLVSISEETAACSWTLVLCSKWTHVKTLSGLYLQMLTRKLILGF